MFTTVIVGAIMWQAMKKGDEFAACQVTLKETEVELIQKIANYGRIDDVDAAIAQRLYEREIGTGIEEMCGEAERAGNSDGDRNSSTGNPPKNDGAV